MSALSSSRLPLATPSNRPSIFRLITLHRLSLVDHPRLVLQNLSHARLQGQPFLHLLESSESICTHSARSILTTLDACTRTSPRNFHYWTLHSVGTAIFALSLHTCRHAASWQARADLEVSWSLMLIRSNAFPELMRCSAAVIPSHSIRDQELFGARAASTIR